MELTQDQMVLILSILLGVSELLALTPKFKSNSVLQLIINGLRKLIKNKEKEPSVKLEKIASEMAKDAIVDTIEKEIDKIK